MCRYDTSTMFKNGSGTETSSRTRSHAYPWPFGRFVNAYHAYIAPTRVLTLRAHRMADSLRLDSPRNSRRHQIVRCIFTDGGTIWMVPEGNSTLIVIVSIRHEGVQDRKGASHPDPAHLCNARARSWGFV